MRLAEVFTKGMGEHGNKTPGSFAITQRLLPEKDALRFIPIVFIPFGEAFAVPPLGCGSKATVATLACVGDVDSVAMAAVQGVDEAEWQRLV
ncbi:hypothetical protein GCM10027276_36720 [Comamonas piscis]